MSLAPSAIRQVQPQADLRQESEVIIFRVTLRDAFFWGVLVTLGIIGFWWREAWFSMIGIAAAGIRFEK
jgi:hypothetical protein